jgi:hypothetical protein
LSEEYREVADWRDEALAEIAALKPYYVEKHAWQPGLVDSEGEVDLFVRLRGRRFPGKEYLLRLRYLPDWRQAGRREAFVDPDDREKAGPRFWPPEGNGLNPNHQHNGVLTPAICLRGVWGFHSVLHADQSMDGASLLRFLVELQKVMDG